MVTSFSLFIPCVSTATFLTSHERRLGLNKDSRKLQWLVHGQLGLDKGVFIRLDVRNS